MPMAPDGTPLPYPETITIGDPNAAASAAGGPSPQPSPGGSPLEMLREGLTLVHGALAADGLNEEEKLLLEKLATLGQQVFAGRQKNADKTMGMAPGMRQALGG